MKVGSAVGHYHIVKTLGGGGMGAVYVANDTRLNRKVALKTLPARMANDPEWIRRFEREAQAVAALNHPNIVTIHSVEEIDDVHFITLEYVGGKTLEDLIPDGGVSLEQFFDIAIPLADAIAAAHKRGIAHRDLKPSNVMVSDEGNVKVLDFGIAKLVEGLVTDDEAATSVGSEALTQEGKIVGTVAYMSPEQAEGKVADHRTDIFSLGIILYEMATGDRPFTGDTNLSIMASIVKDQPEPIVERNAKLPRHLARIVKKALEKDLDRRYQSMLELRNDLLELKEEIDSGEMLVTGPVTGEMAPLSAVESSGNGFLWKAAAGAAAVVAVAAIAWNMMGGEATDVPVETPLRVSAEQLTFSPNLDYGGAVSPDGEWFAFTRQTDPSGGSDIYLQSITSRNAILIQQNGTSPAFSPDGTHIAFSAPPQTNDISEGGGVSIMDTTGGGVRRLTETGFNPAWSPDGTHLVYGMEFVTSRPYNRADLGDRLNIVEVASGTVTDLDVPDGVEPSWSPNGHRIAYWGSTGGQRDIFTIPAAGGDPVPVTDDPPIDFSPVWSPDGNWIYWASTRGGSMAIWRVAIDEVSGEVLGTPEQITTGGTSEPGMLSISADGALLVYTETLTRGSIVAVDFDPDTLAVSGAPVPVAQGPRRLLQPHVSPLGDFIAYRNEADPQDIFIARVDGTEERNITSDQDKDWAPRWSPTGDEIVFYTNTTGAYEIWVMNIEGMGRRRLTDTASQDLTRPPNPVGPIWSPDGSKIAYHTDPDSFIIEAGLDFAAQQTVTIPRFPAGNLKFTPIDWGGDGSRIAGYCGPARTTVSFGICLYEVASQELEMIVPGNATAPQWMADGRRIFYRTLDPVGVAVVDTVSGEIRDVEVPEAQGLGGALVLSPDSRRLFLNRVTTESDIWMATLR